jgi:hypothetical protein
MSIGVRLAAAPSAPVYVEYQTPAPTRSGDETSAALTFRAATDLDQLDVSLAADEGLEVVSDPKSAVFQNVAQGDRRVLTVRIRMTSARDGVLAIYLKTRRGQRVDSDAIEIRFPAAK